MKNGKLYAGASTASLSIGAITALLDAIPDEWGAMGAIAVLLASPLIGGLNNVVEEIRELRGDVKRSTDEQIRLSMDLSKLEVAVTSHEKLIDELSYRSRKHSGEIGHLKDTVDNTNG